jgi:hypothetical protein
MAEVPKLSDHQHQVNSLRFSIAQQKAELRSAETIGDEVSVARIKKTLVWFEGTLNQLLFQTS